jgi:hypothetical protein
MLYQLSYARVRRNLWDGGVISHPRKCCARATPPVYIDNVYV